MTRKILGLVAVLLLAGGSAASAEPFTPELEGQYQDALAIWGVSAPAQCGSVHLEVQSAAEFNVGGGNAVARSTQPDPDNMLAECWLLLGHEVAYEWSSCNRQMVIDHEVGHLLGYSHTDDPSSIMHGGAGDDAATAYCIGQEILEGWRMIVRREATRCHQLPQRQRHLFCTIHVRATRKNTRAAFLTQPPMPTFP